MRTKNTLHLARMRSVARLVASVMALGFVSAAIANEPDQSHLHPPAGDGWQLLETASPSASAPIATTAASSPALGTSAAPSVTRASGDVVRHSDAPSLAVASVVLPGANDASPATLTFTITPRDTNLRDALDRWLQQQGWQLAWRIDDDLPLEFNAKFTGDFTSVLTQVMQATNHMRTPTRICRHINHVIRVIARAATCKE